MTLGEQALEVHDLSISYGGSPVVEHVSFSLDKGAILAIVGPNGSGKSTLVQALLGLIPSAQGSIRVLGMTPEEARKRVGYVPQRFSFDRTFPITVMEFLRISSFSPDKKIQEYLDHLGVGGITLQQLGTLSGGQLQRVLIVRAMLHDPEILYLDEPSSGIDIIGEEDFFSLISHLREKHGMTIVMVSHELDVVHKLASQVLCLNRSLICIGSPESALTRETLQKLYGKDVGVFHHETSHHKNKKS